MQTSARLRRMIKLSSLAASLALVGGGIASAADKVDFNREVLPILSTSCFRCHGPDQSARKAELRLDVRDNAVDKKKIITPGKAEDSELVSRIQSDDEDARMPPPKAGAKLNDDQIAILKRWIDEGAPYAEHWAFVLPVKPEVPAVKNQAWAKSPIDHFVLAKLEQEKLAPANQASREVLIRRATLDLIGLPPTPQEIDEFVKDKSPNAFEKLVDRLLASPHYGERWGRHWLDVARYADSGGFETDIFNGHSWRFRDYVIRSFNEDKPFDRFIREQVAGDELFPGDAEARLATSFYTIGPVLQEAGMVPGKLEYDQMTDAADTTGAAFLGLTMGCARCHDHKYDPITQHEYYGMQAMFADSDQYDLKPDGTVLRGRVAIKNTLAEFEIEQLKDNARHEKDPAKRAELVRKVGDYYIAKAGGGGSGRRMGRGGKGGGPTPANSAELQAALQKYHEIVDKQAGEDNDVSDAVLAERQKELNEVLQDVGRKVLDAQPRGSPDRMAFRALDIDTDQREFLVELGRKTVADDKPDAKKSEAAGATGSASASGNSPKDNAGKEKAAQADSPKNTGTTSGKQVEGSKNTGIASGTQADESGEKSKPDEPAEKIDQRLAMGEKHLNDGDSEIPLRLLAHRDKPVEVHRLLHGDLDQPAELVEPCLPAKIAADQKLDDVKPDHRRAALAEWLASEKNPLTARVIVNRVWLWHFGQGLVRTPNDFGLRGDPPTHPELLDWLTTDFIEHGWSIKHLHRVIMESAAYQMASTASADALTRDPENRLLTHYQPHRVEAEVVWDSARSVAGTLNLEMFGLPTAPPLDNQEQIGNFRKWPTCTPEESNRRAIYILVRRSFRFPTLGAFDLPDNIASCPQRDITTVPTQALTLMNNRTFKEQSAAFADRLLNEAGNSPSAIAALAWKYAYNRDIQPDEHKQIAEFIGSRIDATISSAKESLRPAVEEMCLAVFNTNEFIYMP